MNNRFYDRNGILILKASSAPLRNIAFINGIERSLDSLTNKEKEAVKFFDNLRLSMQAKERRKEEKRAFLLKEAKEIIYKYREII